MDFRQRPCLPVPHEVEFADLPHHAPLGFCCTAIFHDRGGANLTPTGKRCFLASAENLTPPFGAVLKKLTPPFGAVLKKLTPPFDAVLV
jgi:hypothetical protein